MNYPDLLGGLDAAVFSALADDTAAVWTRPGLPDLTLSVMLDVIEDKVAVGSIAAFERADVARLSVAEVTAKSPGREPRQGDTFTVKGKVVVVHGEAWLDRDMGGRDWLCGVTEYGPE